MNIEIKEDLPSGKILFLNSGEKVLFLNPGEKAPESRDFSLEPMPFLPSTTGILNGLTITDSLFDMEFKRQFVSEKPKTVRRSKHHGGWQPKKRRNEK